MLFTKITEIRLSVMAVTVLLFASCGEPKNAKEVPPLARDQTPHSSPGSSLPTPPDMGFGAVERWVLQPTGGGVEFALQSADKSPSIRLFCLAGNRLLVNVPGFRAISSEERLSFGTGGSAMALVADARGDTERGGVTGVGEVPDNLTALVGGRVSTSYGAQKSGPHPTPPQHLSRAFVDACRRPSVAQVQTKVQPAQTTSACMMQGNDRLRVTPRRAVGTEPFWAARIDGRCVNYSHPENQKGTRVWTRYTKGAVSEVWSGVLGQRRFELRMRKDPGCSDGMSDKRYPFSVELNVGGELRKGCAES